MKGEAIARVRRQQELRDNNWKPPLRLMLSVRTGNALVQGGVIGIDQILASSQDDLLRIPDMGRSGITEICLALAEHGLHLRR